DRVDSIRKSSRLPNHLDGLLDALPTRIAAEDHQAVVETRANTLAGHGHSQSIDRLANPVSFLLDPFLDHRLECREVVWLDLAENVAELGQDIGDIFLAEPLLDRIGVVIQGIGEEVTP